MNFRAVLPQPKTAHSAQTHKSITFIWIVWSTLYVYLWEKEGTYAFTKLRYVGRKNTVNFELTKEEIMNIMNGSKWCKVIYPKYSKHWPYTVASTIDCGCSKMLNHGLNHGFFLSLFKLIPCHIHWILYELANSNFIFEF